MKRSGLRLLGERVFTALCLLAVALPLAILVVLFVSVTVKGFGALDWEFLTGYPSRKAEHAGILPGIVGSLYLIGLTILIALPVGVGAALFFEEYRGIPRFSGPIETNVTNLAGVPSVVYGLLGLELFVRILKMGRSLLAGSLTMALLILPIIIISTREALRTVPQSVREGAYALGATRWQMIVRVLLPQVFPGILTGSILAISRAIGETAPLLVVGAMAYMTFLPRGLGDPFTVLPIQIFNWISRPQEAFQERAAAGIIVLLAVMLLLNGLAIFLRNRYQSEKK